MGECRDEAQTRYAELGEGERGTSESAMSP